MLSSWTGSRPTGTCSARCSTTPSFRGGEADVHYLDRRPDLRDAALPDGARRRHAAAAAFCLTGRRAAASLVPIPVAGWRNVGRAQHADALTDATGTLEVRVVDLHEAARVLVEDEWRRRGYGQVDDGPSTC